MPKEKDKVTIKIPRPLYERLKTVIGGSGFSSVNEFVVDRTHFPEWYDAFEGMTRRISRNGMTHLVK